MAKIQPFRGFRYNDELGRNIGELTSPLFDVVSARHREKLYQNEMNSIHLSVPSEGHQSDAYADRIKRWKQEGILIQEKEPAIYVYYQYFRLPSDKHLYCRKGFIANVCLYDWADGVVLRHENTIPRSVEDRKHVLKQTGLNVSPVHGLYTDATHSIEDILDEAIKNPIYDSEDYQGVRDILAKIDDLKKCEVLVRVLEDKKIILADGHHRYQGALEFRNEENSKKKNSTGDESYNQIMMYLTNTESDDLKIFPTHRLVKNIESFDQELFLDELAKYFHIQELEDEEDIFHLIAGRKWAFGLFLGERQFNIRLRQHKPFEVDWQIPDLIRDLDITVLHYYIIEKVLHIPQGKQSNSDQLEFERNVNICYRKTIKGEVHAAILTQAISMEEIKSVCYSGFTMPQKSTYFYPKVICGYLFGSIKPEDND